MTTNRNLAGLMLALLLCWGGIATAQTIHLVTVAHSEDIKIGTGTQGNTRRVAEFVNRAAAEMKVTVKRQDLSDTDFNCPKIMEAISRIKAGPEDVVIFYYSGHGFRADDNATVFPDLFCGEEAVSGGARLANIAASLAQKGARLTITVADACNVPFNQPLPDGGEIASVPKQGREKQYRKLFFGHSGTITLSGSKRNQFSWYYPDFGVFTKQFLEALEAATQTSRQGLWADVLPAALKQIPVPYGKIIVPQDPEREINLKP